jgi:hypothetical protein
MSSRQAAPPTSDEKHRLEIAALEHAVHHETTRHAPKVHAEKRKAPPLAPSSQQRRFPK